MVGRPVIGGERINPDGDYSDEIRRSRQKPDTEALRVRTIPRFLSRVESLMAGKRDYALNEVDFFIRSQPPEERTLAFEQLLKAVEGDEQLLGLLKEYASQGR